MGSAKKDRSALFSFLGLSLLLHLQIVLVVLTVFALNPDGCSPHDELYVAPFDVSLESEQPVSRRELKKRIKKQIDEQKKEERDAKGQVVELPRPAEEQHPDDAKYLSEYDSKVERETKARAASARARAAARARARNRGRAELAQKQQARQRQLAMRARTENTERADQGDAAQRQKQLGQSPHQIDQHKETTLSEQAQQGTNNIRLRLTDAEMAAALGGRIDALQDVREGESTLLNSKRWRFASFFNRVKRQVAQNWHPDQVYRRRDPSGNVYGFKDRLTILRVKLTPGGALVAVEVEKTSGLGFLDDEAIESFRLAEPFPNPPQGLVDERSGHINFQFGFLFEISRRPSFHILRQAR